MSERVIRLTDIGEGVTEAEIVEWQVSVGDTVSEDQTLGAVMTDKAAVDIPSPVAGTIASLGGQVGDVLAVGSMLARIETESDASLAVAATNTARQASEKPDTTTRKADDKRSQPESSKAVDKEPGQPESSKAVDIVAESGAPVRAAPAVRHRASELGLDLRAVLGTGIDGRITHGDLDKHLYGLLSTISAGEPANTIETVKLVGMRRRIARKMEISSRRIPHFSYVEEVDVTELESLRRTFNAGKTAFTAQTQEGRTSDSSGTGIRLTPLPFIIRAMVHCLNDFPDMNAHFDDETDTLHRHTARHVGIATHTDRGLMVPVVRFADSLGIQELAREISRLANEARLNQLRSEALRDATITVTSLGALGGIASTPIINHPEVAILGVNRITERAVINDGRLETRHVMNLSASFDHRIVDGQVAALFIQKIREFLENPITMFMEN